MDKLVVQDITELQQGILAFLQGKIAEDQFRGIRTSKGVYSQRDQGVQMVRIKLPLGKLNFKQLLCIADAADKYANGILHITTRQDIQVYDVQLHKTPELWAKLEQENITLLGSGGNTVRNVTASPTAGIDPDEPFDITPYAHEVFSYFLRHPVSQEMGRKIKIAFSSNVTDTAFTYIHDLGFIPKVRMGKGPVERGFKVLIGGGLGAQPALAQTAQEFLPADQLIPFIESVLRVFGRYGERNNRHKARLKFLIQNIGLEKMLSLIEEEKTAISYSSYPVDNTTEFLPALPSATGFEIRVPDLKQYWRWLQTNTYMQKQSRLYGVFIKIPGGDITATQVRELLQALHPYAVEEIRLTQNQDILFKHIRQEYLPLVYTKLLALGWAATGFDSPADITTCRGTNTCNLGISNSMALAAALEKLVRDDYAHLCFNHDIKIKISGCMNSCGQHALAQIGFHGSSIKLNDKVLPAVQVLLGGGTLGDGAGRIADKIIKVPVKRAPEALKRLLDDFASHAYRDERFNRYYDRQGKEYFYQLLKPLADLSAVSAEDFIDWGNEKPYKTAIGSGECAGVIIDLAETLFADAYKKLDHAGTLSETGAFADAIFLAYSACIGMAKAVLLKQDVHAGTQLGIIREFDRCFPKITTPLGHDSFEELVMLINKQSPSKEFAQVYIEKALAFARLAGNRKL